MKWKPSVTYRLRFDSPWMTASAFFAGLGIFLGTLYYLCFTEGWTFGSLLLPLVLPALLLAAHGVLLKGLRLDFPVVYGGLAAVYFLVALPGSTGEWGIFLWILLLLGALVLTVTALGYLPTRFVALALLWLPLILRLVSVLGGYFQTWEAIPALLEAKKYLDIFPAILDTVQLVPLMREGGSLAGVAAFACFPLCMERT